MAFTMERWHSAVGQRFAVRKYKGEPDESDLDLLYEKAEQLSARGVRILIGHDPKVFAPILFGAGKIKGTGWFAAFVQDEDADDRTVGYLGEAFVLEATALGLGTCWLGMYNKKATASVLKLKPGEELTCITPLGVSAENYAARPRRPLDKLTGLSQEELQQLPEWQRLALECARLAPSATNAQPWAYIVEGENIRVRNTGNNFGYGMLDCGITMLHLELGAAHGGVAGEWSFDEDDAIFTPTSYEN